MRTRDIHKHNDHLGTHDGTVQECFRNEDSLALQIACELCIKLEGLERQHPEIFDLKHLAE